MFVSRLLGRVFEWDGRSDVVFELHRSVNDLLMVFTTSTSREKPVPVSNVTLENPGLFSSDFIFHS